MSGSEEGFAGVIRRIYSPTFGISYFSGGLPLDLQMIGILMKNERMAQVHINVIEGSERRFGRFVRKNISFCYAIMWGCSEENCKRLSRLIKYV